jgi:hypothetical protein
MKRRNSSDAIGAIGAIVEECRVACQTAEIEAERLRELLRRCVDALDELADQRRVLLAEASERIEDVARVIEAEAGVWPEDVDRCTRLAEHVRMEAQRLMSA